MAIKLEIQALSGFPHIEPGADLAAITLDRLRANNLGLRDGDILVFAQKVVSKAEGRYIDIREVVGSDKAHDLSEVCGKDPRLVECMLRDAAEVVRCVPGLIIVRLKIGLVLANGGIDQSNLFENADEHLCLLLPEDPDASARKLLGEFQNATGLSRIGVAIIDSLGRAWRYGTAGTCIGAAGFEVYRDNRGKKDFYGRIQQSTQIGVGDELAGACSLVMGQGAEGTPVVHVRGAELVTERPTKATDLVRSMDEDLFR